jgi:hypothetical protein
MAGNPRKCRDEALRCVGLADASAAPDARKRYLALADAWMTLAAQLESDEGLLDAMRAIEADPDQRLPRRRVAR